MNGVILGRVIMGDVAVTLVDLARRGLVDVTAVTRQMSARFGYRPRTAEWLPVFDF
jgi:hypothetical protein